MAETTVLQSEGFEDAVYKVKASAAAITSLYLNDTRLTYTPELLELVSSQLHEAAQYFDSIMASE